MFWGTDLGMRIRRVFFVYRSRNTHSWDMFLCTDLGMHIRGICFCVLIWECTFVGYVYVYRSRNAHSWDMFCVQI